MESQPAEGIPLPRWLFRWRVFLFLEAAKPIGGRWIQKMPTLRFGKFRGQDIRDVPSEYLEFLFEGAERTLVECREELERRRVAEEADLSWAERIVSAGQRQLARQHHPDLEGGSTETMQEINLAADALREAVRCRGRA